MYRKLIAVFCLVLSMLFLPLSISSYTVVDFSWLKPFYILYETVRPGHWEKDATRIKFDKYGIVNVNGNNYNPVTISQYALSCFDYYRETGDEKYKKSFMNQMNWLLADSVCVEKDDKIYYPYRYVFHDLPIGWTSGLAQGEVIAVLIRYYYITKDPAVLKRIKAVCNYMLTPVEEGGCLKKTPEGGWWIEEYVNSKRHTHVLNGNMISIVCLNDYLNLFPDDKRAAELYPELLASLKNSVDFYDNGSNLRYDRGGAELVKPWYMKAQYIEMKTLYRITKDEFFHRKMMQWSVYCYNKSVGFVECLFNDVNFATPMVFEKDSSVMLQNCASNNLLTTSSIASIRSFPVIAGSILGKMVDNSAATNVAVILIDSIAGNPLVNLTFKTPVSMDMISINYNTGSVKPDVKEITVTFSDSTSKVLKYKHSKSDGLNEVFRFKEIVITGLKIEFERKESLKKFEITDITANKSADISCSEFVYYQSPVQTTEGLYIIDGKTENSGEDAIFYRNAKLVKDISVKPWIYAGSSFPVKQTLTGVTQLMLVSRPLNSQFKYKKSTFKLSGVN
ncbi:MAG: D-glucuronyl C5-epimerase family protein [Bacteroidota bacterium]